MSNNVSSQQSATLTVEQALRQAITHHHTGQLQDAERLYRAILQTQPNHPDANHNLGVLAIQTKQPEAGLPHFKVALDASPNQLQYWLSYIDALTQADQREAAKEVFAEALQNGLHGAEVEALAIRLDEPSEIAPGPHEISMLTQMFAEGRYAEAVSLAQQLTERFPLHGFGWKVLGVVRKEIGQTNEALTPMQKAVALMSSDAEAHSNLGNILHDLGQLEAAVASHRQALQIKPDSAEAHSNLGNALKYLGQLDAAVASYREALEFKPGLAQAHYNLGNALNHLGQLDQAVTSYGRALEIKPDFAEAHTNLGVVLRELGQLDEAAASHRQALEIKPDFALAHHNLSIVLLLMGNFDAGWRHYESRFDPSTIKRSSIPPEVPFPQWRGESLLGKSLLVWHEQGLGDQIQFCRYLSILRTQGTRCITLVCAAPLKSLLERFDGADSVLIVANAGNIPAHDYWTFPLSLPLHCNTTLGNIPAIIPYLYADNKFLQDIVTQLGNIPEFKVGVCWQGGKQYPNDADRSVGLAPYKQLFTINGARFFTLQPGSRDEFLSAAGSAAFDLGHEIDALTPPFEETAALIMNLDLVITCDTSIGHLAGALGKPVWVVLPFAPDWRWMMNREDSPWYPNTRLFRQTRRGDWVELFERVAQRLESVIAGESPAIWPIREGRQRGLQGVAVEALTERLEDCVRGLGNSTLQNHHTSRDSSPATSAVHQNSKPKTKLTKLTKSTRKPLPSRGKNPDPKELDLLVTLFNKGLYIEAENLAQTLTVRFPLHGFAWKVLGAALQGMGRVEEALTPMQKSVVLLPKDPEAHSNLGYVLKDIGQLDAAVASCRLALKIKPDLAEAHNNLGNALKDLGQFDEAVTSCRLALKIQPDFVEAHTNLGNALRDLGQLVAAAVSYRHALQIKPDYVKVHSNLGNALNDLGQLDAAVASYRQALEIQPDYVEAQSNLLFVHNYQSDQSPIALLDEARRFGDVAERQSRVYTIWHNVPEPGRCLRVGLVSADFRLHPVGFFVESVLEALASNAATRLEIIVYSNHFLCDALTDRVKAFCHRWRSAVGLSDEGLTQRIRDDGIDVLIDLSGHTAHNRLPMFAWKPAPVQASWLGYFATTGVTAMDYLIADPWTLPEAEEAHFTERIWRLPETRLCFTPPDIDVKVSPLPALSNGYITFGCFNNLAKLNDAVVALWARVLASVPDSRLFLKAKQLKEASVRHSVLNRFIACGITTERLVLEGSEPRAEYLAAYQRVDIALDPFPFTGGTTSVEGLWMGVPVLTLAGERFVSRQGVGLLMNAGLPEWIATDPDDYVARAVLHAADLPRLAALRKELRQQVLASPIFDAPRFARHFEAALRGMWQKWCDGRRKVMNQENGLPKAR